MNEISRQLRLLNDIVMYLEDEGHQISNRIIVNMNIEAEVEKIIAKGHRSDLTPEVWAIGEKLTFDQLTSFVTLLLKKISENGTSLALNEDNSVSLFFDTVGCVFPIVVVSILPHAEFGPNYHRVDAPHFSTFMNVPNHPF